MGSWAAVIHGNGDENCGFTTVTVIAVDKKYYLKIII